jgi:hypothetical protein
VGQRLRMERRRGVEGLVRARPRRGLNPCAETRVVWFDAAAVDYSGSRSAAPRLTGCFVHDEVAGSDGYCRKTR